MPLSWCCLIIGKLKEMKTNKVIFADQLRAIAVLAVLIIHWCGIYWGARDVVGEYIYAPPVPGAMSPLLGWLMPPTFNYGPFGVSIFFLISGFVIPFSLRNKKPVEFLTSRVLRIYPTYVAGTCVMLLSAWLSSLYWGADFVVDFKRLIANVLLVHMDLGYPSIDLVNWTLAIEIKFYIVCALMFRVLRSANIIPILAFSLGVLGFCEWIPAGITLESLKIQLLCLVFMFIGTCFYFLHLRAVETWNGVLCIMMLLGVFIMAFPHTQWSPQIPDTPRNYIYGLALFSVFFCFRNKFRPIPGVGLIAKVSYPIYIIHSVFGYALMRALGDIGVPFEVAIVIAFISVLVIACGLHVFVERPTMNFGKQQRSLAIDRDTQAVNA